MKEWERINPKGVVSMRVGAAPGRNPGRSDTTPLGLELGGAVVSRGSVAGDATPGY